MSVAAAPLVEEFFAPVVHIPARAHFDDRPPAEVVALYRPSERSIAPPLRLTRRGVVALALAVAALAVVLLAVAALSAPGGSPARGTAAATVTVRPGDTLWAIAGRVAPQADPRAEVAHLQRLNGLSGVDLVVGQQLRLR